MNTCSIQDSQTKEPKIFYKSDNGEIYSTLYEVLNNSQKSYQTGVKNQAQDFVRMMETPVFDESTQEGQIQNHIRNGYLTGKQIAPNTYEAVDEYASEILNADLLVNNYKGFRRNGLQFEFGDFKAKVEPGSRFSNFIEAGKMYLAEKSKSNKPRPENYTKDQLQTMIENFMKKVGFSITSIESYKKNYKTKFGIEPNAEALIDFNSKVIAFAKGEVTLDQLSEEFSHFMVEALNQDDIKRMLAYVNNTQEYIENAEHYRQVYSKQVQDPVKLEELVRREILGKMLANSLQKDFSLENKTETERNIFQRLSDMLKSFINFIQGNITTDIQSEIDMIASEIKNHLFNENLERIINTENISPIASVMYSLDRNGVENLVKKLRDFQGVTYTSELERQVDEIFNTSHSAAISANHLLENPNGIHGHELDVVITNALDTEDLLTELKAIFRKADYSTQNESVKKAQLRFRDNILRKADATLRELSDLKGNYKYSIERNAKEIFEKQMEKQTTLSQEAIDEMANDTKMGVEQIQSDTNAFIGNFGHTGKTSNLFVGLLNKIIENLQSAKVEEYLKDFDEFLQPLLKYKGMLKNFVKNGSFKSGVDNEKLFKDEREYELSILKQVYGEFADTNYDGYLEKFQDKGRIPIDKTEDSYFKFRYLYDQGLQDQKWLQPRTREYKEKFQKLLQDLNLGSTPWTVDFYKYLINKSENRSKDKTAIQRDREMSNPYYEDGSLKNGFTPILYGTAKAAFLKGELKESDFVSVNSRHALFSGDEKTEPKNSEMIFRYDPGVKTEKDQTVGKDGESAYYSMKWNNLRASGMDDKVQKASQENFIQEYSGKKKSFERQGLKGTELNTALKEWIGESLLFEPHEGYWDSFNPADIQFKNFYDKIRSGDDFNSMKEAELKYRELQIRKKLALKKYKNQNDYKEIDVKSMSTMDKSNIDSIEESMTDTRNQIAKLFELHNVGDVYSDSKADSNLKLNVSFHEDFMETIQVSFEDASQKELESFFSNTENMKIKNFQSYLKLKNSLNKGQNTQFVQQYRELAQENNIGDSNDAILKSFLISNSPSWYKRYDANAEYDNFIRDYNSGKVDIDSLVQEYMKNPGLDQIRYSNTDGSVDKTIRLRLTPSFKYSLPSEPNIEELLESYKELGNETKSDMMQKLSLLQQMGGVENIDSSYRESMSEITDNIENLKGYIAMMNAQMQRLQRERMLRKHFIFLVPQVRKTTFERLESFSKKGNKLAQSKDYIKEAFTFRADDFENSYKSLKIPHYGYYRLQAEELTDDIFHSLAWGLSNANHYEQRLLHSQDAFDAIKGLESQTFERGKRATDTNYYKMMKEMMDFNFYGKTISNKIEFKIPGVEKPLDLSKMLFGLKSLSIVAALAFSPIVAVTNFTSGVMQNVMLSATGRNIYSPANARALSTLTKLTGGSIKDIGSFDPQSKINKIMYGFGVYDLSERFLNSKLSKGVRLLPEAGFSMMAMTNFPLEAQSTLAKIMEYRLIDGRFVSWRQFSLEEKAKDATKSDSDIKSSFESFSKKTMYDYIKEDGKFDTHSLQTDGYQGNIEKDKRQVMSAIRNVSEQTTMEIAKHHEGSAGRNPTWSFVLSLKKWLVMATSSMTSRGRFDFDTGGKEEGLMYTPAYLFNLFKTVLKDKQNIREAYSGMSEIERKNIKTTMVLAGISATMLALAIVLKKSADDKDEEDNYLMQLSAYMAMRTLNESFSGNIGIGESYFEAIQNPIMVGSTVKNMTNFFKLNQVGEKTVSGKYKGMDKYWVGIMKATSLRNPYTISSASVLSQTRQSYEHFNTQDSFYHIFDLIPGKPKEGE